MKRSFDFPIKRLLLLLLLLFAAAWSCPAKSCKKQYTNPIRTVSGESIRMADPFVYKHDGVYYLTGTSNGDVGFDCYASRDLVRWEFRGALFRRPADYAGTGCFWAPEVKAYEGRFYLTFSCLIGDKALSCLAVSDRPEGPFEPLHTPWFDLGESAIDCHIFVDDDPEHTPYLFYSRNGSREGYAYGEIWAVRLRGDLSGFDGEPQLIGQADQPWELVCRDVNRCNEGPFVIKHADTYYMTYSGNDTGHSHYGVGVATAPHPLGPWTKYDDNPQMITDFSRGISSPGHNSIVESPDGSELFVVYHRHADPWQPRPAFDRVACIDRIRFDAAGRMRIVGPSTTPQPLPR